MKQLRRFETPLVAVLFAILSTAGCRSTQRSLTSVPCMEGTCGLVANKQTNLGNVALQKPSGKNWLADQQSKKRSKVVPASFTQQIESDVLTSDETTTVPAAVEAGTPWHVGFDNSTTLTLTEMVGDQTLTLEMAEQMAVGSNPDLQQAQAAIESLKGKHLQVGLKPNPQVGYLSADMGEEGTAGQQGAFFSQEFIRGGKLELNRAIVCREIKAAEQQFEIDRQRLLTDVRRRFYDLLVAQEKLSTVQKFEQLVQQVADTSEKLFQGEEISKIANLRTQLQVKNIRVIAEQAQNELAGARRRFAATTGQGSLGSFDSTPVILVGEILPSQSVSDPASSIDMIILGNPELAQAAEALEAAKWNLNRQIAEPTRNVQVQAGFTHSNVTGDDLVALQIGVPLLINDRNQGNIASARAEVNKAAQNIASIERDLSKRFSVAWRDYENARIQTEKFQNEILPAALEFYELVESAYREGEQDYLDLVSAQQIYLDASLQRLNALRDFWRAASLIDGYLLSDD